MHLDQALDDRQAEAGAFFRILLRERAAAERRQHDRDFVLAECRGRCRLMERYCPPAPVQPTLSVISPPCGVNLMALVSRLSVT